MENLEGDDFLITWKQTQKRYVDAHAGPGEQDMKACPNCDNVYPATTEHWHKDAYAADGFQTHCKKCRNMQSALDRKAKEADVLKKAQEDILDRINLETNAGRGLTPGSEVQEHVMDMFGGSKGLAAQLVATYAAAKPGSAIREKVLRMIFQSAMKLEESGMTTKNAENMSDEELVSETKRVLKIYEADSA